MTANKYRKKPIVIEARQIIGPENVDEIAEWSGGDPFTLDNPEYGMPGPHGVVIDTLEGEMHAEWGDWIIKGVKGEFYPCKPDIFKVTYEAVEAVDAKE